MRLIVSILSVLFVLSGCIDTDAASRLSVDVEASPMFSAEAFQVRYGSEAWQVADAVVPRPYGKTRNVDGPVVIWIHGGGWREGQREDISAKVSEFVRRTGIISLNIDHKLGTLEAPCWPQAREDIRQAVKFALGHGMPGVSGPVYLWGYSSGGTLALKYALEDDAVRAVVAVGAPLDFEAWLQVWPHAHLIEGFGEDWAQEDPGSMLDLSWPQAVLLHGSADPIVPAEVNQTINEALPQVRLVEIAGGDHLLTGRESIEVAEALKTMLQ